MKLTNITKKDINDIITALMKCRNDDDCDGCPYDGICRERCFALENHMVDILETVRDDYLKE